MPKVWIVDALSKRLSSALRNRTQSLPGVIWPKIKKRVKKKERFTKQEKVSRKVRKKLDRDPWDADDWVVVLTCRSDHNDPETLCTSLLEEFSELIVYDIGEHIATRYRKPTRRARMTIDEVFSDLNSLTRPRKRLGVVPIDS